MRERNFHGYDSDITDNCGVPRVQSVDASRWASDVECFTKNSALIHAAHVRLAYTLEFNRTFSRVGVVVFAEEREYLGLFTLDVGEDMDLLNATVPEVGPASGRYIVLVVWFSAECTAYSRHSGREHNKN